MSLLLRECTLAIPLPEALLDGHRSLQDDLQRFLPGAQIDRDRDPRVKLGNIYGPHTDEGLLVLGHELDIGEQDIDGLMVSLANPFFHRTNYGGVLSLVAERNPRLRELFMGWRDKVPDIAHASGKKFKFRPHLGFCRIEDMPTHHYYLRHSREINALLLGLNANFPVTEFGIWGKHVGQNQAQRICAITGSGVSLVHSGQVPVSA